MIKWMARALLLSSLVWGRIDAAAQQRVDPNNPLGHIIYPAQAQSESQQVADKQECYAWASEATGLDPFAAYRQALAAEETENAAAAPQGDVVAGAVRGAVFGVVIGAIAGDASEGAAIGAASGGLIGLMRRRNRRVQAAQSADQQRATAEAQLNRWDQGYSACLEGRGYTVR